MGVFKKQGIYWIDYYVNGHRKRERIGTDKRWLRRCCASARWRLPRAGFWRGGDQLPPHLMNWRTPISSGSDRTMKQASPLASAHGAVMISTLLASFVLTSVGSGSQPSLRP
jgi:hypothetical protein